jgi:hypothetical protein
MMVDGVERVASVDPELGAVGPSPRGGRPIVMRPVGSFQNSQTLVSFTPPSWSLCSLLSTGRADSTHPVYVERGERNLGSV